ncbi:MAG: hypothetical protein PW789_01180 [Edaphobacter sp.]|uniref:hypothetical protein n=1 Tax=Edaphobacter sp. TaxID=1934404 RepID=UPI0023A13B35|nr:hypothetical protein [Edaphobacter sp.]MDE1175203.1 hypothetical protein [Edaphobacter sp.]
MLTASLDETQNEDTVRTRAGLQGWLGWGVGVDYRYSNRAGPWNAKKKNDRGSRGGFRPEWSCCHHKSFFTGHSVGKNGVTNMARCFDFSRWSEILSISGKSSIISNFQANI